MERRAELFEAPEMGEIVELKLVELLPETCYVGALYTLEGTVKLFGIGAPPWVYVEIKKKEWYKPEVIEEVSYERGLPKPISGKFSIDLTFDKVGSYEVTVVATPAPLTLPVIGVAPVVGRSDKMEIEVEEPPPPAFRFSAVTIDGSLIELTNHDIDSGLLLPKTTADKLEIIPSLEWTGPRKEATISVKAGYRDWTLGFSPKTAAYTQKIILPDSPTAPYTGETEKPIIIPLTACGGLTDGAIEIVLKIAGVDDYISRIWNVYATKIPPERLNFDIVEPSVSETPVEPGVTITITCPVTSRSEMPVDARAKVIIYEGSIWPGHGDTIKTYDAGAFHIEPYETKNIVINHKTVAGSIDRRDVEVEIWVGGEIAAEREFDDVFYVGRPPEEAVEFELIEPTVLPAPEVIPGTDIVIVCPVISRSTEPQTAKAKVIIYEGSDWYTHGRTIAAKETPSFEIAPEQTFEVKIKHTTIAGTIDLRDVEVEIYIAGKIVKESEWDDVYKVKVPEPTLEVESLELS